MVKHQQLISERSTATYLDGVLTLSIQLENVAMMASARRRGWRHVFENNLALADCVFGDVGDEPMNAANQRNIHIRAVV